MLHIFVSEIVFSRFVSYNGDEITALGYYATIIAPPTHQQHQPHDNNNNIKKNITRLDKIRNNCIWHNRYSSINKVYNNSIIGNSLAETKN